MAADNDGLFGSDTDLNMFLEDPDPKEESKEEEKSEEEKEDAKADSDEPESGEGKDDEEGSDKEEKDPEVLEFSDELDEEDIELAESAPFDLVAFKKEFPKAFDKFPQLRPALIREQKFTEIFPTIEEAQAASNRAEAFRNFEAELVSGQSKNLLNQLLNNPEIKRDAPKAFEKFTDNYLTSLKEVSPAKYNEVIGTQVVHILRNVKKEALRHKNENLEKAVAWVTASLFDAEDPDHVKLKEPEKAGPDTDENKKFEAERQRFNQERYDYAMREVSEQVSTRLATAIADGLDPNKRLNEINHKSLVDRIAKDIDITLSKDDRHGRVMRQLWERAGKAGFTAEWRNKIRDTYIANAQRIMPSLRMKRKDEAFKRLGAGKVADSKVTSGKAPTGVKDKVPTNGKGNIDVRKVDFARTSDKDIFNDRITLRK